MIYSFANFVGSIQIQILCFKLVQEVVWNGSIATRKRHWWKCVLAQETVGWRPISSQWLFELTVHTLLRFRKSTLFTIFC